MKTYALATLCLALVVSSFAALHIEPSSPTFFWANYEAVVEGHKQIGFQTAEELAADFVNPDSQNFRLKDAEVIIIFVERLATETFTLNTPKFSNLKNLVQNSASSFVSQFTTGNAAEALITEVRQVVTGDVYLVGDSEQSSIPSLSKDATQTLSLQQFLDALSKGWESKKKGKVDLVVVSLESSDFAAHDAVFNQVSASMKNTKYISIVASTHFQTIAAPNNLKLRNAGLEKFEQSFAQEKQINYFPLYIIEMYLIVGLLLIILFTGVCCNLSIQSDLKYDLEVRRNRASS